VLFNGPERTRWLGLQVAVANFLGIVVALAGGYLGLFGWKAPFLTYSFALLLLVPCLFILPRPQVAKLAKTQPSTKLTKPLKLLVAESCVLIFVASTALFTVVVQAGFLFELRGATDSAMRGLGIALGATGIAFGATVSGMIASWTTSFKVRLAFLLMGGGLVAQMLVGSFAATAAAGAVAGFGSGFVIPALLSRLLGRIPAELLGGVTGIWIAATFVGQFSNPPMFIVLKGIGGSQAAAIGLMGAICLVIAALLSFLMRADASQNQA
jgi:hypothetical protein